MIILEINSRKYEEINITRNKVTEGSNNEPDKIKEIMYTIPAIKVDLKNDLSSPDFNKPSRPIILVIDKEKTPKPIK